MEKRCMSLEAIKRLIPTWGVYSGVILILVLLMAVSNQNKTFIIILFTVPLLCLFVMVYFIFLSKSIKRKIANGDFLYATGKAVSSRRSVLSREVVLSFEFFDEDGNRRELEAQPYIPLHSLGDYLNHEFIIGYQTIDSASKIIIMDYKK